MKNLEKALYDKKISDKALCELLGVTEKTLQNKMTGETDFTRKELYKIKYLFPEYEFLIVQE